MNALHALKGRLRRSLPTNVLRGIEWLRESARLRAVPHMPASAYALGEVTQAALSQSFADASISSQFTLWSERIDAFRIIAFAGGVNMGDRRAIFHLVSTLRPSSVLEIGTHIGASTVYMASALASQPEAAPAGRLTTVDIIDVNDPYSQPWKHSGSPYSPKGLLSRLELAHLVEFVAQPSLDYLRTTTRRFDLIFLDGDHSAATVYQEVPAALSCLNPGGVILLHDYYPQGKPLWSNGVVRHGPWLALRRLIDEGTDLCVVPFADLPWETKLGSHRSSLALLSRRSERAA